MSVWFVIPSKRPIVEANRCLEAWHDMGYLTCVLREAADGRTDARVQRLTACYVGWARSVNLLVLSTIVSNDQPEWFVTGGDDYFPDPNKRADIIAEECNEHFAGTFGVMQPTGDRWGFGRCTTCKGIGSIQHYRCDDCGGTGSSAIIDRICGSPWMGRDFCTRMYHGGGPLYNGYYHNFADEELQHVARKLGVLWQRRDLTQKHEHWARPRGDVRDMPEWAAKINDPQSSDWERSKALFAKRKAAGFPGHEPLEG